MISIRGRYNIVNPVTNKALYKGRVLRKARVIFNREGINIKDRFYPFQRIRVIPIKDIIVY